MGLDVSQKKKNESLRKIMAIVSQKWGIHAHSSCLYRYYSDTDPPEKKRRDLTKNRIFIWELGRIYYTHYIS